MSISDEDYDQLSAQVAKAAVQTAYLREEIAQATAQALRLRASHDNMLGALKAAVVRIELANHEGNPILSAWLPDARATILLGESV